MDINSFVIGHSKGYNKGKSLAGVVSMEENEAGGISYEIKASEVDKEWFNDGKTHLFIEIATEGRMDVPLRFNQSNKNCVTIDWGDGSELQTINSEGNVNTAHTYASVGKYVITLDVAEGCTLRLGNGYGYCVMGNSSSSRGYVYCNMLKGVEFGSGVRTTGEYAFQYCYSLASVALPNSVTSDIGNYALYNCYSLENITLPNGVVYIGQYAFYNCHSLASIVIPNSVTSIGMNAFANCHSLASIVIPNSVTRIEVNVFNSCTGIKFFDFTKHTSVPTLSGSLGSLSSDYEIRVPMALVDEWKAATNWSTYESQIVGV